MRRAFTLIELLVTVSVIAVLIGILMPVLSAAKAASSTAISCRSLSQLAVAGRLYLTDHDNLFWPWEQSTATGEQYWFGFETWQSVAMPEGQKTCDYSKGPLGPYTMTSGGVKTDPTFLEYNSRLKPKFQNGNYGYGYNTVLSGSNSHPHNALQVTQPSQMIVFATCAQINDFEAPATPANPMIEEFYYIYDPDTQPPPQPTAHFRHGGNALAAFLDGSVRSLSMATDMKPGSQDMRIPSANIGTFNSSLVKQAGW
jgi:prepilin-type N-terminal cleavage/methylation domain-containing protein/prepilin-type processing-associated H-X9-DG protein